MALGSYITKFGTINGKTQRNILEVADQEYIICELHRSLVILILIVFCCQYCVRQYMVVIQQ